MAPEIFAVRRGTHQGYGFGVDVWALGICFYGLLCEEFPFGEDAAISQTSSGFLQFDDPVWNIVSCRCQNVIDSILKVDPERRATTSSITDSLELAP